MHTWCAAELALFVLFFGLIFFVPFLHLCIPETLHAEELEHTGSFVLLQERSFKHMRRGTHAHTTKWTPTLCISLLLSGWLFWNVYRMFVLLFPFHIVSCLHSAHHYAVDTYTIKLSSTAEASTHTHTHKANNQQIDCLMQNSLQSFRACSMLCGS